MSKDISLATLFTVGYILTVALILYTSLFVPLGYDEAYNMQVVDSLSKGQGYSSYGLVHTWNRLFDPRVTTGPMVLLPASIAWNISGNSIFAVRITMLLFYFLYAAGLFYIFKMGGSNKLQALMVVVMSSCIVGLPDFAAMEGYIHMNSQGWPYFGIPMGRILGELPAAASIILASVFAARDKPFWAALAVGIAIQMKLTYLVPGAIILIFWAMATAILDKRIRLHTLLAIVALVALPTIAFEIYRLISFWELNSYIQSLMGYKQFIKDQSELAFTAGFKGKVTGLWSSVSYLVLIPSAYLLLLFVICLMKCYVKNKEKVFLPEYWISIIKRHCTHLTMARISLVFAGLASLCLWLFFIQQQSSRHALPFALLFVPPLFWYGITCYRYLKNSNLNHFAFMAIKLSFYLVLVLAFHRQLKNLLAFYGVNKHISAEREQVINIINSNVGGKKIVAIHVDGWWQNPEYQLFFNKPTVPETRGDVIMIVQDYQLYFTKNDWAAYKKKCRKMLYRSKRVMVCVYVSRMQLDLLKKGVCLFRGNQYDMSINTRGNIG